MNKRILLGCIAAIGLLVLFAAATFLLRVRTPMTPLGELPLLDLVGVLVAMTVGGAIAGPRFRLIGVALMAAVWLLSVGVMTMAPDVTALMALRYNLIGIIASLALAWIGAVLGPKLLARYQSQRARPAA